MARIGRPLALEGVPMTRKEHDALQMFNNSVLHLVDAPVDFARFRAVNGLSDSFIKDLASAFRMLWPHWFMNGRGELADGTAEQAREVCHEIIDKIRPPKGLSLKSPLGVLATMGGMRIVNTGRRGGGAVEKREGSGRGYRIVKFCDYHPENRSVSYGLCARCNGRKSRIETIMDMDDAQDLPNIVFKEIMEYEGKGRDFMKTVVKEVVGRHLENGSESNKTEDVCTTGLRI